MALTSEVNKTIFACTGGLTYDFLFKVFDEAELEVVLHTIATGAETTLTLSTDYSVSLLTETGGRVTTVVAYGAAYQLIVLRKQPKKQEIDYTQNDILSTEVLEEQLDKIVMMVQELQEQIDRAVLQDVTQTSQLTVAPTTQTLADIAVAAASAAATSATSAAASAATAAADIAAGLATIGINAKDYASINAAVTAIGATPATLLVTDAQTLAASLTVPATCTLKILQGGSIVKAGAFTLTINGNFEAGLYQVFSGFATGNVTFGKGVTDVARPEWWGFAQTAAAAVNSVALQAAIDSNAPAVQMPNGSFDFDTGITLDRAIWFRGSGSCEAAPGGGTAGVSTTKLNYTGVGNAITLVGSGAEGKENVNMSDFSLWGTALAGYGIIIGSTTFVLKCMFKNIHVRAFTKVGVAGILVSKCLESTFENVYSQANYDGIVLNGTITTCTFINCWSRTNLRYGWYIVSANTCAFYQCLAESNDASGIRFYSSAASSLNFYGWFSSNNCRTTGDAPLYFSGSGVVGACTEIHFFGGYIEEAIAGVILASIDMNYANAISFYDMQVSSITTLAIVTANTTNVIFYTTDPDGAQYTHSITGNTTGQMRIVGSIMPPKMTTVVRDALANPLEGEVVYNTTTKVLNFYNGAAWGAV